MKGFLRHTAIIALLALAIAVAVPAAYAKGWEPVRSERSDLKTVGKDGDVEIKAARGLIIINTGHTVNVKVVTILGQTVAAETLQPGNHQLSINAHGVYIVKVGDSLTAKVAL